MGLPPLTPLAAAVLDVRPSPERVLALEGWTGEAAFFLAREFPTARVRGIDPDAARLRRAAAKVGLDPEGRVAFKLGKPRAIPYPDEFFDLLVAVDVKLSPREARRVLGPGGQVLLVATCPRAQPLDPTSRWLWRRLRRRGIALLKSAEAGDGSFSVGRLRGDDSAARAD